MRTETALHAARWAALGVSLALAPLAFAAGRAPTAQECKSHPLSPVVQGGCIVINRKLGNCMACHVIAGTTMDGDIGPALRDLRTRFPNKAALFAQIYNPTIATPTTAMPPFGKDRILTRAQIRKVVDFLWTL